MVNKTMKIILTILGILWIILPDPIIGPFDDALVLAIEVIPVIRQTRKRIQGNQN